MKVHIEPARSEWSNLVKRPVADPATIEQAVGDIIQAVKTKGDAALKELSLKFDGKTLEDFRVSEDTLQNAGAELSTELKEAIEVAYQNIYKFHLAQKSPVAFIETMPGVSCWRKSVAIEKVGLYIPGGTAPLFSTVLMLGIPAQIAGCNEVVLCSPSTHSAILYCAHLVGIKNVFTIGGAQAIAAMANGTESIPKVYKIFGPGNQFVTTAKQLVTKEGVAIDMPAGPSEVAVYADTTANPTFIAADLLAQAEHGKDSQVLLVATEKSIIENVQKELAIQMAALPREALAAAALENSNAVVLASPADAIDFLNEYAAEHLIIQTETADQISEAITNAGSVFIGHYTPESCGDYASGTNHTLPTNSYARAYSGVSLDSFVKKITFQKITESGLKILGPHVEIMAEAEQLSAHKNAVSIRLK